MVIRASQALGGVPGTGAAKLQLGESIAVNGVCVTARDITAKSFAADLSPETLERTDLGSLKTSSEVNLERAMTPSTRFGGHIVQGHVDGVGKLAALDPLPDGNYWLSVEVPAELERYIVWKGSIALNGISLTVARLEGNRLGVAIIPHTYENTALRTLRPGDPMNVECDVLSKYVEKLPCEHGDSIRNSQSDHEAVFGYARKVPRRGVLTTRRQGTEEGILSQDFFD